MPNLQERRRRALYRAAHRGTSEMDWLLGKFAEATVPVMSADELEAFEVVLALPDPDLWRLIVTGDDPDNDLSPAIARIRQFHKLHPSEA
jgi:antitoxin CptB